MAENTPDLLLDAQDVQRFNQVIMFLSVIGPRFRDVMRELHQRRARALEEAGRLAWDPATNAELLHRAREHPPLRQMNSEELDAWNRRVPETLIGKPVDEPFTVWTGRMTDENGRLTVEWGVQAHTWDNGVPTSSLFVVVAGERDALAMTKHLRAHPHPDQLAYLNGLASTRPGEFVAPTAPVAHIPAATADPREVLRAGWPRVPLMLTEQAWEAALRKVMPPSAADRLVVRDPAHPHHRAWVQLHRLANQEFVNVGANPERLADIIWRRTRWNDPMDTPAAVAHGHVNKARGEPGYVQRVVQPLGVNPPPRQAAPPVGAPTGSRMIPQQGPVNLSRVDRPAPALLFAQNLDPDNPLDRLAARQMLGHFPPAVDQVLLTKFPGLAADVVTEPRDARAASPVTGVTGAVEVAVETPAGPVAVEEHKARVAELDPGTTAHQREAFYMLGHTAPAVDQAIAEKFAGNERIEERVRVLYPNGFPEAQAAAHHNLAHDGEVAAAAGRATPDNPSTPQDEHDAGLATGAGEHGHAATHHGLAAGVPGEQSPVVRRTTHRVIVVPDRDRHR
ncbi:hypothetical protein [Saccharothrix sp. ALI-22-I]|uniref:hypothetical protein n=1 Tax=Saccharothrix sp. ALI-22-I TaxID=1933778 RepID=UPI00117AA9FF|nr:hypothetical protein [Saccharothrix sp. ALI-22-I]